MAQFQMEKSKPTSGGDSAIMRLGPDQRVRLLGFPESIDRPVPTFRKWRQHRVSFQNDPDRMPMFVVCAGSNCPLCARNFSPDGEQRFPAATRYAINVWDYESNSVKAMIGGPMIFNVFISAGEAGTDVGGSDWTIQKSGQGLQTTYNVVRHDAAPFEGPADVNNMLHDLSKYDAEPSVERIFELLEMGGWDYDSLAGPEFSLDEAMAFEVPFGEHKGSTVEQLVTNHLSWAEWFYNQKIKDGQVQHPLFLAIAKVMDARSNAPAPDATTDERPIDDAQAEIVTETLISPDGDTVEVPVTAAEALIKAGFERKEAEAPVESDDDEVLVKVGGVEAIMTRASAKESLSAGLPVEFVDAEPEAKPKAKPKAKKTKAAKTDSEDSEREAVEARVKDLLSSRETGDYQHLLDLFQEVAGKRDISKFSVDELRQLEDRLTDE